MIHMVSVVWNFFILFSPVFYGWKLYWPNLFSWQVRGCLALLDYENSDGIEMWVLEDYENNLWMKESIKWRPYPKKVGNPISFGNESSDEMLLTPNVMSHEYILCPYHLKKESMRVVKISGLPDWLSPIFVQSGNFNLTNHNPILSPLVRK